MRQLTIGLLSIFLLEPTVMSAEECSPRCDFYHNYGPYQIGPGLYCYPQCGPQGDCSPFLVCKQQGRSIHGSNPKKTNACLPDGIKCASNYDCCSGNCGWIESSHAYLCASGGFLAYKHPPRPTIR
jgi:hypothetical protein